MINETTVSKHTNEILESLIEEKHGILGKLFGDDKDLPIPPAVLDVDNTLPAVSYSVFQMNNASEELKKTVEEGQRVVERFNSLAAAIVQRKADIAKNPKLVQDADIWNEAFGLIIPFFSVYQDGERTLESHSAGTEVANKVLNFACNVIANGIGDFKSYLEGIAEVLSTKAKETKQSQIMLYTFAQHNLFKNSSGVVQYFPQISYANTHFSLEQSMNLGFCSKTTSIDLNLKVTQKILTFNINSYMKDSFFREKCDSFLNRYLVKSINEKETTLDELFGSVEPSV